MGQLTGPEVWHAATLRETGSWRFDLTPEAAGALAASARSFVRGGGAPELAGRADFESAASPGLFDEIHASVEHGAGLALLGGLPLDVLSYPEQVALTCGVSDLVGSVVAQNYEGQRIVDVRDEGIEYSHRSRGYRSNKHLPFHTDGAHLFSLTCLGTAASGGETILASAGAAYNVLSDESPELLEPLCRGFFHHRRGQHDPGESPLSPERVPVFAFTGGLLHCCYNRNPIEWACREGVELSAEERQALDGLDAVLARESMQLRLQLQAGECLFVNNFNILHSRTTYRDDDSARRHMFRVWMTDPRSRRAGVNLLDLYVPARFRH